jgi:hypothetical protein
MPQNVTVYAVPAAGGTPTVIRCTRVTSRMEIRESPGFQGLIYQQLTPTQFGNYTIGPAVEYQDSLEPLVFAGYTGDHPPNTVPIGNGGSGGQPVSPGGPETLGTPIVQLTSLSATATSVAVTEWF